MKRLIVKQEPHHIHAGRPYKVVKITNSVEWSIGDRLTRDELKSIMNRHQGHIVCVEIR